MYQPGYRELALESINNGAAIEIFTREMNSVLENISDVNTIPKEPRKVTIEFTLTPNEDRTIAALEIKGKTKLAPLRPVQSSVMFQDRGDGQLAAWESDMVQPELKFDNVVDYKMAQAGDRND